MVLVVPERQEGLVLQVTCTNFELARLVDTHQFGTSSMLV